MTVRCKCSVCSADRAWHATHAPLMYSALMAVALPLHVILCTLMIAPCEASVLSARGLCIGMTKLPHACKWCPALQMRQPHTQ